jgi:hypothetical protein
LECRPGRAHRDEHVAGADSVGAEHLVGLDYTGRRAREVVLVGAEQPGMLGGLAAEQGAPGLSAGLRDALNDCGDASRNHCAAGYVVGHEQRLGAADHDVVDDHGDQVDADGVVDVEALGDLHLGADAVGARGEQRATVALEGAGVEQAGEAAYATHDLGPVGLRHPLAHQRDGPVACFDVDTRVGIGDGRAGARLARQGHAATSTTGRLSALIRRYSGPAEGVGGADAEPGRDPVGVAVSRRIDVQTGQGLEHVLAELR